MQLKTILNRVEKQKGFVYSEARMTKAGQIEFTLQPRRGSKPICGDCSKRGATYDHSTTRRFEFVPLWAIAVFFVYRMRRVDCRKCGVTTERVPWACGNNQQTFSYRIFLATWAKRLLYVCKERTEVSLHGFFYIINLVTYLSQKEPTDSADEANG